jgi:3-hydroxyacyl-[acyl-carrier-protein] dehydratase
MLLVDRIEELEPGRRVVATKAITICEPCYAGLDGDLPVEAYAYPASLLLESFGQVAALLWLADTKTPHLDPDSVLMLVAARDCRIESVAYPGDVLRHVARIEHVVGDNVFVAGESHAGERRIAVIESMMAARRPKHAVQRLLPTQPAA